MTLISDKTDGQILTWITSIGATLHHSSLHYKAEVVPLAAVGDGLPVKEREVVPARVEQDWSITYKNIEGRATTLNEAASLLVRNLLKVSTECKGVAEQIDEY